MADTKALTPVVHACLVADWVMSAH